MSTNKTEHLNLHAWEPFDPFTRGEFNENFALIDAAVGKNSEGLAAALSELRDADAADKAELLAADQLNESGGAYLWVAIGYDS